MNAVEKESRICIPNQQGEEGDDVCACVCVSYSFGIRMTLASYNKFH